MSTTPVERAPMQSFHWRGLTSFAVTLGFLLLVVTGAVLYLTPQGRVAQWTDWRLAGLGKEQWSGIHMTAALLFLVAACFHLYFNWGIFLRYLKPVTGLHLWRELSVALAATVILVAGTLLEWPPFGYVIAANDGIKAYWDAHSAPGPYPHAEASTLPDFAQRVGVPVEDLQVRLAGLGLPTPDASTTIADAARQLGMSPSALFERLGLASAMPSAGSGTGAGLGRQTVEEVCRARGIDPEEALRALEADGVAAESSETLRDIAERTRRSPAQILACIEAVPAAQ